MEKGTTHFYLVLTKPEVITFCLVSLSSLLVTHLKCEGHADISHNELVLLQVGTKLDKGELDARGGVIAGAILVENIQANGKRITFLI